MESLILGMGRSNLGHNSTSTCHDSYYCISMTQHTLNFCITIIIKIFNVFFRIFFLELNKPAKLSMLIYSKSINKTALYYNVKLSYRRHNILILQLV